MKRTVLGLIGLSVFGLSVSPLLAEEERCEVSVSVWQPRSAVIKLAEANGWSVKRIKISDGCYEIKGRDSAGRRIEVMIHPQTLEILFVEYEEVPDGDDVDHHFHEDGHDHRSDDTPASE